eukprot:gene11167-7943_t
MKVHYDGGQWYHMAENFLVQHSLLKKHQALVDGKSVWYNFDKGHFTDTMNAFTRLVVYLGTVAPENSIRTISFMDSYPSLLKLRSDSKIKVGDGVLLHRDLLESSQTFRIGPTVEPTVRFSKLKGPKTNERQLRTVSSAANTASASILSMFDSEAPMISGRILNTKQEICFKYMGDIGGQLIRRDEWFPSREDIVSLRHKIRSACPPNEELMTKYKKNKPFKLVVYQRDLTRRLENQEEVLQSLRANLPKSSWQFMVVMHDNDRSPCELSHILNDADVLLTPHGFQSTLLLFLPTPALIFEIFPFPYYKPPYKLMAQSLGVVHASYFSPPTSTMFQVLKSYFHIDPHFCNQFYVCRDFARRQNVILQPDGVENLLLTIRQAEPLFQHRPAYTNTSLPHTPGLQYQPIQREFIYGTN